MATLKPKAGGGELIEIPDRYMRAGEAGIPQRSLGSRETSSRSHLCQHSVAAKERKWQAPVSQPQKASEDVPLSSYFPREQRTEKTREPEGELLNQFEFNLPVCGPTTRHNGVTMYS